MNAEKPGIAKKTSYKFIYKLPIAALVFSAVMVCFFIFVTISALKSSENVPPWLGIFSASCALLFIFLGLTGATDRSDIFIDKNGISRAIFDKKWKVIPWENVDVITVKTCFDRGARKTFRLFEIQSINKSKFAPSRAVKMIITERMERPREFTDLMDDYISLYKIKLESTIDGIKTYPVRLKQI
jgi:hypothetical protein